MNIFVNKDYGLDIIYTKDVPNVDPQYERITERILVPLGGYYKNGYRIKEDVGFKVRCGQITEDLFDRVTIIEPITIYITSDMVKNTFGRTYFYHFGAEYNAIVFYILNEKLGPLLSPFYVKLFIEENIESTCLNVWDVESTQPLILNSCLEKYPTIVSVGHKDPCGLRKVGRIEKLYNVDCSVGLQRFTNLKELHLSSAPNRGPFPSTLTKMCFNTLSWPILSMLYEVGIRTFVIDRNLLWKEEEANKMDDLVIIQRTHPIIGKRHTSLMDWL
jgi:hypothetical protein